MKITCSKRDDIIKQRDEYQADYDRRKALYDEDERRFEKAEYDQYHEVEEEIKRRLDVLQDGLNITVSSGWGRGLEVKIDNGDSPFKEGIALSWRYSAKVTEDGEVKAETGSWSGLNAITTEQLENLHATVETLEAINAIDWKELLDVATPRYSEYVTHKNPQYDKDMPKPNFDQMLFEADIEEAIGKNVLLHKPEESDYTKNYYYKVVKATPKFYKVVAIRPYVVEDAMQRGDLNLIKEHIDSEIKYARNMDKDKLRRELGRDYEMINY